MDVEEADLSQACLQLCISLGVSPRDIYRVLAESRDGGVALLIVDVETGEAEIQCTPDLEEHRETLESIAEEYAETLDIRKSLEDHSHPLKPPRKVKAYRLLDTPPHILLILE